MDSSRGTWTVPGGSSDAWKLGRVFAVSMMALDTAISRHGEFRERWAREGPPMPCTDCPSPDELAKIKRMLAILTLDMLTGGTLTITEPDRATKLRLTAALRLPGDIELLLREASGADKH